MDISINQLRFFVSFLVALLACAFIALWYVWPAIAKRGPKAALPPLLLYACLRVNGLMFLMPGLVSRDLPAAFAVPTAFGDLTAATLALIAAITHRYTSRAAIPITWVFNVLGTVDLIYANVASVVYRVDPAMLGVAYYLAVVNVPAMLVVHFMIFAYLLRPRLAEEPS
jgi:hypothetical protein